MSAVMEEDRTSRGGQRGARPRWCWTSCRARRRGTLKLWIGASRFLARTLKNVRTKVSLQVLAYNLKRDADPRNAEGSECGIVRPGVGRLSGSIKSPVSASRH